MNVVQRPRRGFSLVEILVAMTLTLAVFAIALPFVRSQSRALGTNAGRLDAEQVARYAQRAIDKELRLVQADPGQSRLVMAGPMAIAFNANVLAPDSTDTEALEVEAGAPAALTESGPPRMPQPCRWWRGRIRRRTTRERTGRPAGTRR